MKLLKRLRRLNPLLCFTMLGLIALGGAFIYSACSVREDVELKMLYMRHIEVAVVGLPLYLLLAVVNYRELIRRYALVFYLLCLTLLLLVPLLGEVTMGARRWLFGIQPAEPAKLAIIMLVAWLFGRREASRGGSMYLLALVLLALPATLILLQPDLGTVMVMAPTVLIMLFAARVAPRLLGATLLSGALAIALILGLLIAAENEKLPLERRESLISMTRLKPHQVRRLQVFLFPDKDLHGSGYNRRQSEIAVGSGGFSGKGYLKGVQYTLGYLPPSVSSNDFIFAVLAEELGFVGSVVVLLLFAGLLGAGCWIALRCKDDLGRLFALGFTTLVFCHTFINIAMTIGQMPITGLPLPFISYGRSFMLTLITGCGILQSIAINGTKKESKF